MTKKQLTLILLVVSALAISVTAAFFSVYGLSKMFAGASLAVIVMASVLEASKLVTTYSLHAFKELIPKLLRGYLIASVIVLMIITSAGIYGFLSNAYQITASKYSISSSEVSIVQAKMDNLTIRLEDYQKERESIIQDISELRNGLSSGTRVEYIDKETGQKISSTSSAVRKSLESQLNEAFSRRDQVANKIEESSTAIDSMKIQVLEMQSNDEAAAELGPIIYISRITGFSMDQVVNYFILMLIIVFDPLAVCLVITVSYLTNSKRNDLRGHVNEVLEPISTKKETDENISPLKKLEIATLKPEKNEEIDWSIWNDIPPAEEVKKEENIWDGIEKFVKKKLEIR